MRRQPIFIDLDGPLLAVKARYHGVYASIAKELGVTPLPMRDYWQAKRERRSLREFFPGCGDCVQLHDFYLPRWLSRIERPEWLMLDRLQRGAEECLTLLSELYSLHLVTLRRDAAALDEQLDWLNLRRFFTEVHSGWADGRGGALMKMSWLRPHLAAGPAAVVGDSEIDMLAARLLRVRAIGVSYGIRSEEELLELGAAQVIHQLRDLPEAIGTCGARPRVRVRVRGDAARIPVRQEAARPAAAALRPASRL